MNERIHRVQKQGETDDACPLCAEPINSAGNAGPETEPPRPFDFSLCFYCAGILEYDENLRLREYKGDDLPAELLEARARLVEWLKLKPQA